MTVAEVVLGALLYPPKRRREEALEYLTRSRAMPLTGPFDLWGSLLPCSYLPPFTPPRGYLYPPPVIHSFVFPFLVVNLCVFTLVITMYGHNTRSFILSFPRLIDSSLPRTFYTCISLGLFLAIFILSVMLQSPQGWFPWQVLGE